MTSKLYDSERGPITSRNGITQNLNKNAESWASLVAQW